jgi:hypothetical protein
VGVLVPLFSLRRFTFSTLTVSSSLEVIMVRQVELQKYRELTVLVRVHARTIDSGASIDVIVRALSQTPEAPGVDFVDSSSAIATATIASGTTSTLVTQSTTSAFGRLARIVVKGSRGASGVCTADFAADLVLKE